MHFLVLLLFIGLAMGFEFTQFSKIYTENTNPQVGSQQDFINSTVWRSSPNVALSDNLADPFNYSIYVAALSADYSLFGNSSLEIDATHTNNITAALANEFNVDCTHVGLPKPVHNHKAGVAFLDASKRIFNAVFN